MTMTTESTVTQTDTETAAETTTQIKPKPQDTFYHSFALESKYCTPMFRLGEGFGGGVFRTQTKPQATEPPLTEEEREIRRGTLLETQAEIVYSQEVAVKKLHSRSLSSREKWATEPEIEFALNVKPHNNLIHFHDMFVDTSDDNVTILMELMDTDLLCLVRDGVIQGQPLPKGFDQVKYNAKEILKGISHIHNSGFIHRDLKPENVLISRNPDFKDGESDPNAVPPYFVKITDFGFCTRVNTYGSRCGTKEFAAPELVVTNNGFNKEYFFANGAVDIWAFGSILFQMASQRLLHKPYKSSTDVPRDSRPAIEDVILPYMRRLGPPLESSPYGGYDRAVRYLNRGLGKYAALVMEKLQDANDVQKYVKDPLLRDVITSCLQWDPDRRPSTDELLKMPYFSS